MRELSIIADESGGENGTSRYCAVTLVFHDQAKGIRGHISAYERALGDKGLEDIPFHASPLLYGKKDYASLDLGTRKKMLAAFFVFARSLPVAYKTFLYRRSEVGSPAKFTERLAKDLSSFVDANLGYFQQFDAIKIYYDGGQGMVTRALRSALEAKIAKQAIVYRKAEPEHMRLFQVADFLCTIELTATKYERRESTRTDEKVFGTAHTFRQNYLRKLRKLALRSPIPR